METGPFSAAAVRTLARALGGQARLPLTDLYRTSTGRFVQIATETPSQSRTRSHSRGSSQEVNHGHLTTAFTATNPWLMTASTRFAIRNVMSDADFRAMFEGALDPMLLADDDARYVDANPAACSFFRLSRAEICSRRVVDFAPEPARAEFDWVWKLFLRDGTQQGEYTLELPDGRICDVEFSATADVLRGRHMSILRDVTGRKRSDAEREEQIALAQNLARTDPLTGLSNRRVWNERIVAELHRAARSAEPLTVAVIDLDDFKALNDTRGHPAGDRLLQAVAAAWQQQLRETDLLVRAGGDEFWLLFPACPPGFEDGALDRMQGAMPPGQSFSVGTATWDGTESASQLLDRADQALYQRRSGSKTPTGSPRLVQHPVRSTRTRASLELSSTRRAPMTESRDGSC